MPKIGLKRNHLQYKTSGEGKFQAGIPNGVMWRIQKILMFTKKIIKIGSGKRALRVLTIFRGKTYTPD